MTRIDQNKYSLIRCLVLLVLISAYGSPLFSKQDLQEYQLSKRTDSLVSLLAKDITANERVLVLEAIKNEDSEQRIRRLKTQLESINNNEGEELRLNLVLGRESKWIENIKESYTFFSRALFLAEKLKDQKSIAIASLEIGNNIRLGNISNRPFESYFQRAIELFEILEDPLSQSYLQYAKVLLEADDNKKVTYSEEAIELLEPSISKSDTLLMESLARHYNVVGLYASENQRFQMYNKGLATAKSIGSSQLQAYLLNNMGYEFLMKGEYDKAIPYHLEALDVSIKAGMKGLASNSFNNLSVCYRNKGDFEEALDYYHCFFYIQSDLNTEKFFQDLAEVKVSSDLDRIELQNELLVKDQKLQARQRIVLFSVSLLLLITAGFIYWSRQKVKKTNQKLKVLDKAKSRFFANISHELRTPITLINAPLETLLNDPRIKSEEVKETVQIAQQNGKRLLSLVEEILDLAKLEAGKLQLVENPSRVKSFVDDILMAYRTSALKKKVDLQLVSTIEEDLTAMLDEQKCAKVLHNLLSNAMKFTPEGGKVILELSQAEDELIFKVKDTGIGIHPNDLPRVFDRFYQTEELGKKAEGGTGIGLALSKELSLLMGGNLAVESTLSESTSFTFSIQLKRVNEEVLVPVPETQGEEIEGVLKGTIKKYAEHFKVDQPVLLITEDHPEMRAFVAKTLRPYFQIKEADNGKSALEILKSDSIDIVISDVMMPIMDGFELLAAIKDDENLKQISIVMLTARAESEDKLQALTLGIDDYLTKPFSSAEFLARIKNILENRIKILKSGKPQDSSSILDQAEHFESLAKRYNLKERELEILKLLVKRQSNAEIAEKLFVSTNTVKYHLKSLYQKLGVTSRKEILEMIE